MRLTLAPAQMRAELLEETEGELTLTDEERGRLEGLAGLIGKGSIVRDDLIAAMDDLGVPRPKGSAFDEIARELGLK